MKTSAVRKKSSRKGNLRRKSREASSGWAIAPLSCAQPLRRPLAAWRVPRKRVSVLEPARDNGRAALEMPSA